MKMASSAVFYFKGKRKSGSWIFAQVSLED